MNSILATTGDAGQVVDARFELFAGQGFDVTSVREIETAAGFAPRLGALYQDCDTKRALLDAGLQPSSQIRRRASPLTVASRR